MTERLTKKVSKTVQDKYILGTVFYYDFNGLDNTNALLNKLGKLEDILEKYGIGSVEELDETLDDNKYSKQAFAKLLKECQETTKDRDTWKKVAEKEAGILRDINYKLYNEDRIDFENYFYQQALKEGKDGH